MKTDIDDLKEMKMAELMQYLLSAPVDQLNIISGIICKGYELRPCGNLARRDEAGNIVAYMEWEPATDSHIGKSQAWDLIDQYDLNIISYQGISGKRWCIRNASGAFSHKDRQRFVVAASINRKIMDSKR